MENFGGVGGSWICVWNFYIFGIICLVSFYICLLVVDGYVINKLVWLSFNVLISGRVFMWFFLGLIFFDFCFKSGG